MQASEGVNSDSLNWLSIEFFMFVQLLNIMANSEQIHRWFHFPSVYAEQYLEERA